MKTKYEFIPTITITLPNGDVETIQITGEVKFSNIFNESFSLIIEEKQSTIFKNNSLHSLNIIEKLKNTVTFS
jgi:hypothetical protein